VRNAFADEINALAASDPRVVLLSGDIGNRLFDPFKAAAPDRFMNCGVAEANMMSVAAGMALNGLRPVVYTIAPFVTTRCLEQIRVDVCYHHVPVVIVGVGAGLSYASLGATHHSCEDIALLRALPNMSVVAPADAHEVRGALRSALQHDGPVYMRIGKKGEPLVHDEMPEFAIGKANVVRAGRGVCFLANGTMVKVALDAADRLAGLGLSPEVVSFHTIKPLDQVTLERAFAEFDLVVTVEEHSLVGGLGSGVAEWLADTGPYRARLLRVGTPDTFLHQAGEQDHARAVFGLTPEVIAERVRARLVRDLVAAA
jgi:transketolase